MPPVNMFMHSAHLMGSPIMHAAMRFCFLLVRRLLPREKSIPVSGTVCVPYGIPGGYRPQIRFSLPSRPFRSNYSPLYCMTGIAVERKFLSRSAVN